MASSGSFQTNSYSDRSIQFNWWVQSQSIAGNYTVIGWNLVGSGSYTGWVTSGNFYASIEGSQVYSSSTRIKLYQGTTIASGSFTIYHNSNGTRSFSAYAQAGIYTIAVNCTGSGSWDLPTIPRYTSITRFDVSKISGYDGLTKVKIDWSASDSCDWVWYSTDNGGSWQDLPNTGIVSGLSPGTGYNFKLRVRRTDSQLTTDSGTYYQTTYASNSITSDAPNISNGNSLHVTATNPSGSTCQIRLETILNNVATNRYTKSGTDVTFTTEEIDALMQYFPNNPTFSIRLVADTLNGTTVGYNTWKDGTYTIINSNPIFTAFNYLDSNQVTIAVTGDSQYIIKNKSTLKIVIPASNKMTTQNYATPVSYRVEAGNLTGSITYSEDEVSIELGQLTIPGLTDINVTAIDSRGNLTTITTQIYVIDYATPTQIGSVKRVNDFENTTKINASGIFSLITCGSVDKNTIEKARYRYKESTATSWNEWVEITFTIENNAYTCSQQVIELDNELSYNFEIEITDKLETFTLPYFLAQGIPIEFINASKKNVGIGCINDKEAYSLKVRGRIYLNSGKEVLDYDIISEWE